PLSLHDALPISSKMFITRPKVIETVTGEQISAEDLGGAHVHNAKSGNAHLSAKTEEEALDYVKQLLSYLPDSNEHKPPVMEYEKKEDDHYRSELLEIVPYDTTRPYDIKKVVNEIVDEGSFFEIHKDFAKNIVGGIDIDSSD